LRLAASSSTPLHGNYLTLPSRFPVLPARCTEHQDQNATNVVAGQASNGRTVEYRSQNKGWGKGGGQHRRWAPYTPSTMRGQERQPVGLQAVQHSWCLVVHATSSRLLGIDCEPPEAKQARSCGTGGKEKIGVNGGRRGPPDADHSLPAPYSPYCWKPRTLVGPAPRFYPRPDGTAASAPVGATWPRRLPRL